MTSKTSSLTVKCPECGHVFPLDEAVLGSVRDAIQKEVSVDVAKREHALEKQLSAVSAREAQLQEQAAALDKEVQKQLGARLKEVETKARHAAEESLSARLGDLQAQLADKAKALKDAQELELGLRRDQRRLKEEREAFDLEMARKLDAERDTIRRQATEQVAEQNRLKVAEKECQRRG